MPRRHVESREVVVRRLHLTTVDDLVPEAEKDVFDLASNLCDQVQMAGRRSGTRQRHVERFLRQAALELGARELIPLGLERVREPPAELV